ncbi:MAG: sigma-54-dependent Fis family transcriptional regulator [Fibrobacteres bacterium]|nr:sigma-54-dependent Fis family transcriptional regulator [Fibrobacterota bacterium]
MKEITAPSPIELIKKIETLPKTNFTALLILCEKNGKILHFFDESALWRKEYYYGLVIEKLRSSLNISDFLITDRKKDLSELASANKITDLKIKGPFNDSSLFFHTDLPLLTITFHEIERDYFLGVIFDNRVVPNFIDNFHTTIIYINSQNHVLGYNNNFLNLFSKRKDLPASLLGINIESLMTPTPIQIQSRNIEKTATEKRVWHTVKLDHSRRKSWSISNNKNESKHFLIYDQPFSLNDTDIKLSIKSPDIGSGCLTFSFGNGPPTSSNPHFIISKHTAKSIFQLKKYGFSLKQSQYEASTEIKSIEIEKSGSTIIFRMNDSVYMTYYDIEIKNYRETYFYIGLRPLKSAVISELSLEISKMEKQDTVEDIVTLKTNPVHYFKISRIFNSQLSLRYPDISAYSLSDVTQLKKSEALYIKKYENEKRQTEYLADAISEVQKLDYDFIGETALIVDIKEKAKTIAASANNTLSVSIQGPTGSGKEVLAHFLHRNSERKNEPFIKIDCSAFPSTLIDSELFGHEKGAFTGAIHNRTGRIELAQNGTLFIDEINNMSLATQAKLLQFLQDRKFTRIGGTAQRSVDVWIISASNENFDQLVASGKLRKDLYYRLNSFTFTLPSLSARIDDISILSNSIIAKINRELMRDISGITDGALSKLKKHNWPGNIRELENTLRKAIIFCKDNHIDADNIDINPLKNEKVLLKTSPKESYHLKDMTKERLTGMLHEYKGNIRNLSKALHITRKACYDNIKKFELDIKSFR